MLAHVGIRDEDIGKRYVIYLIWCNASGKGYVGQTRCCLNRRWLRHAWAGISGKDSMTALCRAMQKYGIDTFSVYVLQQFTSCEELNSAEEWWIAALGTEVPPRGNGYNLNSGGGVGRSASMETRRKMSIAHHGKVNSSEARAKIAKSKIGIPRSEEAKLKMAAAARGKIVSTSTRAKISESLRGRPVSAETRAKIAATKIGKPRSALVRAKLSRAQTGKRATAKTRARMVEAQLQRWARIKKAVAR